MIAKTLILLGWMNLANRATWESGVDRGEIEFLTALHDSNVDAVGECAIATKLSQGAAYAVTVKTQPTSPAQFCTMTGGIGTMGDGDVTKIVVVCTSDGDTKLFVLLIER